MLYNRRLTNKVVEIRDKYKLAVVAWRSGNGVGLDQRS